MEERIERKKRAAKKNVEKKIPINALDEIAKKMKKKPEDKLIYNMPLKKGMEILKAKGIEEKLLDYMQKYHNAAMRQYKDTIDLNRLLEQYKFFIRCIIYGFIHGDFKGETIESKNKLYKEVGHRIEELGKQLDLRGCVKQADIVYIIFGKDYIDRILLSERGYFNLKKIVKFENIKDEYGDDFIKRVYEAGIRQGVEAVSTQWIKWKIEAKKLIEAENLANSIAK